MVILVIIMCQAKFWVFGMVIYRFSNVILWLSKVVLVSKVISCGVEFIDVTPILRNI